MKRHVNSIKSFFFGGGGLFSCFQTKIIEIKQFYTCKISVYFLLRLYFIHNAYFQHFISFEHILQFYGFCLICTRFSPASVINYQHKLIQLYGKSLELFMLNFATIFTLEALYLKLHFTDPHVSCQNPTKYISWQTELIF